MHTDISQETKKEVLARLRRRYAIAGAKHKSKLIEQAMELLGYHRKAAIRALRREAKVVRAPLVIMGRPREYEPEKLLPILRRIWFAALQPCGSRLQALLPEWLEAYQEDHQGLQADIRSALLRASARTLERLISPLRVQTSRRSSTRPGNLLRQSIPIRGPWSEQGAGWLEVDTVALCGGKLDDRHLWMLNAVDIRTDWTEQRALENRGQYSTLAQLSDLEASLPFALRGLDSDNGGEFINHHVVAWLAQRPQPVLFTRSRPYRKNDNAHVEQRNWTHVRQHFGYERYDNPAVVSMINALCKGPLGLLLNHFLPTNKLEAKRRLNGRTTRIYGKPQTPYARILKSSEVTQAKRAELQALHVTLNPFQLGRDIQHHMKQIHASRLLQA